MISLMITKPLNIKILANSDQLSKLKEGVNPWNAWRKENPTITPDLTGSDREGVIGYP